MTANNPLISVNNPTISTPSSTINGLNTLENYILRNYQTDILETELIYIFIL